MEMRKGLPVIRFKDVASFDRWLATQPRASKGLWLKLAKKDAEVDGLSKAEAVDAALCHGWIDGQLDKYDEANWLVRFTPRRPASKWSEINRSRAVELIAQGRMRPAGLVEVEAAKADGRWDAAYAPASSAQVPPDLQAALDASPEAAAFFATLKGVNRYAVLYHVSTAKKPETRAKRIADFIAMLQRSETVHG